ncbi:MAG: hypothetical protein ACHQIM_19510 [Sphingobacteriales bacterium]
MDHIPAQRKKVIFKSVLIILVLGMLAACSNQANNTALQAKVDSLGKQLAGTYKPGLGEFMTDIQVHHAKLWFAGKNKNWELAGFEIGEIHESVDYIKRYCTDRPEIKSLPMLYPAIDSVNNAVKLKNPERFQASFAVLTSTCNSCHLTTNHAFNVIKIPDTPPFSNQEFKVK